MMRIIGLCIALSGMLASAAKATEMTARLSIGEARRVAEMAIDLVENKYVLEGRATTISNDMRARLEASAFDIEDPDQFADKFHSVLAEVSDDLHMSFRRNVELYEALKSGEDESDGSSEKETAYYLTLAKRENFGFAEVEYLAGNIGYLNITGFWGEVDDDILHDKMRAARSLLSGAEALIIDLRRNGGGSDETVRRLQSWFFDRPTHVLTFHDRAAGVVTKSMTLKPDGGVHFGGVPLYILVGTQTRSAAEDFAYTMKAHGKATLIGETTSGAGHLVEFYPIDTGYVLGIATGRPISPLTGKGWEGEGAVPHISVPEETALIVAQTQALKTLKTLAGDEEVMRQIDWALLTLADKENPPEFTSEELGKMVGHFGVRQISLIGQSLYYARDGGIGVRLVPLNKTVFRHPTNHEFAIRFVWHDDAVVAIEAMDKMGNSDINRRDQ